MVLIGEFCKSDNMLSTHVSLDCSDLALFVLAKKGVSSSFPLRERSMVMLMLLIYIKEVTCLNFGIMFFENAFDDFYSNSYFMACDLLMLLCLDKFRLSRLEMIDDTQNSMIETSDHFSLYLDTYRKNPIKIKRNEIRHEFSSASYY